MGEPTKPLGHAQRLIYMVHEHHSETDTIAQIERACSDLSSKLHNACFPRDLRQRLAVEKERLELLIARLQGAKLDRLLVENRMRYVHASVIWTVDFMN